MNKQIEDNSHDEKLSLAIAAGLAIPAVKFSIVQSIPNLYLYNNYWNIIVYIMMLFYIIPTIKIIMFRKFYTLTFTFITLTIFILISLLFFPENKFNIYSEILRIYTISFVFFILTISINKYDLLFEKLIKSSYVVIIFSFFMFISTSLFGAVGNAKTEYNMSLSYYCLVPTMMMYINMKMNKNIVSGLFFGIGLMVIVGMGARGTLISLIIFLIMDYLKDIKNVKDLLKSITYLFSSGLLIYFYGEKMLYALYLKLQSVGIQSRTLEFFFSDSITSTSNRSQINKIMWDKIKESPISGKGLLNDLSPHNIITESFLFYGVILGSIVLLVLTIMIIQTIFIKYSSKESMLLIVLFCYAIPDALLNLSVIGKDIFWIYVALSLNIYLSNNKRIRSEAVGKI